MTLVKICGVTNAGAFDAVVEAGADYLGLNFFPPSPRYLLPVEAEVLCAGYEGATQLVGLFVNPSFDEVDEVLHLVSLDVLQIHGTPALVQEMRTRFGRPVWHALGVEREADFPGQDDWADGYVVEAKPPQGASRPGGNAVRADWELLSRFRPGKPWLLAGGLTPDNVAEGLRKTGAPGADVSSGVETAPGQKSPELIRAFVRAVRNA